MLAAMYVYSGKTDVALSLLTPVVLVCAWGAWGWETFTVLTLRICSGALLGLSLTDAWRANRCAWRALIAFPAKYILTMSWISGYLAVMGAFSAVAPKRSAKDRLGQAATAGVSACGFLVVRHWIKRLTRPPQSTNNGIVDPPKTHHAERQSA